MKKNKMMRMASMLLILVLLTTCTISGTFAKYTTQDSASDTARVAKWGVELQVVGNLYGDTYKDLIVTEDDRTLTVQSVDKAADVVAPGTKNDEGFTFSLKGQPEVDGTVTTTMKVQNVFLKEGTYGVMLPVDAGVVTEANFGEFDGLYKKDGEAYVSITSWENTTFYTLEDYVVVSNNYYPVVYKLAGSTSYSNASYNVDSLDEIAKLLAAQLGEQAGTTTNATTTYELEKTFESNTNLETWLLNGLTLTWEWAYDRDSSAAKGDATYYTNGADTILGMLENTTEGSVVKQSEGKYVSLNEYTDYCLDTQFSIDITVTQVD